MAPERIERLLAEVQEWCKAHNVSQTEIARLLGVNPQHITEWKKGRSRPSGENALAMLELLKTKPKGRKDAVRILSWESEGGLASGQQAIEKWFASQFASSPGEFVGKLLQVYPVGDEISAISEWRWEHHHKGYHALIYVRDADTWMIRVEYLVLSR